MTLTKNDTLPGVFLYVVVFFSGMTTLAIELSASRLLGNVFGTSNLVWANVIGLMLLYLTVGYFIGGWLADRSPYPGTLYTIIVWAAFLSALIPLIANPVLFAASSAVANIDSGIVLGAFISVVALFALPITLLGTVSPFAIRLAVTDIENAGRVSGRIYAISTLGSIIGTFLPVLLFIPLLGTTQTFLVFGGILFVVGLIGLWQVRQLQALHMLWMPGIIILAFAFTSQYRVRAALSDKFTVLYEGESAYNYIQVQEHISGYRFLFLNEGQGIHSQWHPDEITYNRTWSYFLTAPYFNIPPFSPDEVRSIAVVGLAAGTIPRQHFAVYDDIDIDGIEIDPEITQVGAKFFQMNEQDMPQLHVIVGDGRYEINRSEKLYDVVAVDAYRPPYIPWHLTTSEYFQEIERKLTPNGVVAINVGRTPTDRRLVDALTTTLLDVFPSVHAIDVPGTFNTILVATQSQTDVANLEQNLASISPEEHPLLVDSLQKGADNIVPINPGGTVFTDNRAPVELLVDSIVLNFLFSDEVDTLRE